jgi:DegV family protein with EDD domain
VPPVAVVTDSTSYLPRGLVAERGIAEVSLYVRDGAGQRRELDIDDYARFYDDLRAGPPQLPTTSQPSIGDFAAVYEPLVAGGRDVVSVHVSGGISGTVETARQAAAEVLRGHPGRRIEVVDSTVSAGALGLVALAAARASAGGDVHAAVAGSEAAIGAMRFWFAVDTLEYLRRGGRIGAAQAWLGAALKIKPILTLDGEITPVERVRTSGRAFERMVEYMRARAADGADAWVVQHIRAPDVAERLVARGREIYGCAPAFVSEVGPVIGAHVGPGLVGFGAIPRSLVD